MSAPAEQRAGYRIAAVCLGNICRSPMAEVVLRDRLRRAGLGDLVEVASAGTGGWHVGNPMDPRAAQTLREAGYDPSGHQAQQVDVSWFVAFDLVLAMDDANRDHLSDLAGHSGSERLRLFGDFDPVNPGAPVPDPYYGGRDGFEEVLAMIERTADGVVSAVRESLSDGTGGSSPAAGVR